MGKVLSTPALSAALLDPFALRALETASSQAPALPAHQTWQEMSLMLGEQEGPGGAAEIKVASNLHEAQ